MLNIQISFRYCEKLSSFCTCFDKLFYRYW